MTEVRLTTQIVDSQRSNISSPSIVPFDGHISGFYKRASCPRLPDAVVRSSLDDTEKSRPLQALLRGCWKGTLGEKPFLIDMSYDGVFVRYGEQWVADGNGDLIYRFTDESFCQALDDDGERYTRYTSFRVTTGEFLTYKGSDPPNPCSGPPPPPRFDQDEFMKAVVEGVAKPFKIYKQDTEPPAFAGKNVRFLRDRASCPPNSSTKAEPIRPDDKGFYHLTGCWKGDLEGKPFSVVVYSALYLGDARLIAEYDGHIVGILRGWPLEVTRFTGEYVCTVGRQGMFEQGIDLRTGQEMSDQLVGRCSPTLTSPSRK